MCSCWTATVSRRKSLRWSELEWLSLWALQEPVSFVSQLHTWQFWVMVCGRRVRTAVSTMALKVLTTREQSEQSTELVEVTVVSKTVLVPSSGNANTGCNVVQFV